MKSTSAAQQAVRSRDEQRFRWLIEIVERHHQLGRYPTELIDTVWDKVNLLLMKRPDYGHSRAAVKALVEQQLEWSLKDWWRKVKNPDGTFRPGPAGAISLQTEVTDSEGDTVSISDRVAGPEAERPDRIVEGRLELEDLLNQAGEAGERIEVSVVGAMVGWKPAEIADKYGVKANTVHKWSERFRTIYRADTGDEYPDSADEATPEGREIMEVAR